MRRGFISQGTLENIVTGFSRTWQRPPTEDELRGLMRDDTIVRRLRQKLEFLSDDLASRSGSVAAYWLIARLAAF